MVITPARKRRVGIDVALSGMSALNIRIRYSGTRTVDLRGCVPPEDVVNNDWSTRAYAPDASGISSGVIRNSTVCDSR